MGEKSDALEQGSETTCYEMSRTVREYAKLSPTNRTSSSTLSPMLDEADAERGRALRVRDLNMLELKDGIDRMPT